MKAVRRNSTSDQRPANYQQQEPAFPWDKQHESSDQQSECSNAE
eukprot:CAMPEP_0182841078 /NCGR_PEP_ID=MMETSP0006_2-20121128/24825_1 /TAXON_ID=97485 /ORGANISM="Prymnesium parvum, Strain Texoma1" /LENGTH=43 /DNA_ID= /DNA_START= /DNA_END= /DNA_ORIENTATION=